MQVAEAIEVAPGAVSSLKTGVLTAILAVGVSGLAVCVLVLLLGLLKTGLSTALLSSSSPGCCAGGSSGEPG